MMSVRDIRPKFRVLLIVLLVVDVAAAAVLLSPLGSSRSSRLKEDERARQQWQDELHKALPTRDIDKKIAEARAQQADFFQNRLPSRDSAIAEELGRLASQEGVRFSGIHYNSDPNETGPFRRVEINASLAGDYIKVVKFMNALERDKMFFIIDSIGLSEQQAGNVQLQIKLESYVRQR